jgi:hypothetical protein
MTGAKPKEGLMNENKSRTGLSRRKFIQRLSWTFIAGTLLTPGTLMTAGKAAARSFFKGDIPLDELSFTTFAGHLGDRFEIRLDPTETISAELVEVTNHTGTDSSTSTDNQRDCFAVLFQTSQDHSLEQNTYVFDHPEIGQFSLFIVPVGMDKRGRLYEAVFNRLVT